MQIQVFLISNFCHVLNVVFFLLGNSPASEFYMLTFRNTLSAIPWPTLTRAISLSHTCPQPLCGLLPLHYPLCNRTHPYSITLLTTGSGYFRAKPSPIWIPQQFSNLVVLQLPAYEDGTDRVFQNVSI
jgi:hypothetical protein